MLQKDWKGDFNKKKGRAPGTKRRAQKRKPGTKKTGTNKKPGAKNRAQSKNARLFFLRSVFFTEKKNGLRRTLSTPLNIRRF
jgi:hypothetical protein